MEVDVTAIKERYERAVQIVHELSHEGRQWTMSLPADETNDPDIVLRAALRDINTLLIEMGRLLHVADAADRLTAVNAPQANELKANMDQLRTALQAWKEA